VRVDRLDDEEEVEDARVTRTAAAAANATATMGESPCSTRERCARG
jgi:hypothetical protein